MASQANAGGNSHEQSFGRPQLCLSDSLQGEMLMTPRNGHDLAALSGAL
jgi:hypothetical protein